MKQETKMKIIYSVTSIVLMVIFTFMYLDNYSDGIINKVLDFIIACFVYSLGTLLFLFSFLKDDILDEILDM